MLNKKLKRIISLCAVVVLCLVVSLAAFASNQYLSAEEVFPTEQVEALQKEVSMLPVQGDKAANGEFNRPITRSSGTYPTRKGVILVTDDKYKGVIPTGHAGIVYSSGKVVESLQDGVVLGENDWNTKYSTCYGASVVGTTTAQDSQAADWCYKQIGKPYNWNYFNVTTREKFYCSQLVWASFYDNFGIDLSTSSFGSAVHPSELIKSSYTNIIYKK